MGILNITPDSFSDGGDFFLVSAALKRARAMVAEGAAIIDVGGESTRPGAAAVDVAEELRRVIPVISALSAELSVPISIDTSKPEVMRAAVQAGAGMINDVCALRGPDAVRTAVDLDVPICLMHMHGDPRTMQSDPSYGDVVAEVHDFLAERVAICIDAGLSPDKLLIDPGFGFGKTPQHNLQLLKHINILRDLNLPILVGVSRKSFLGVVVDAPLEQRLHAGLAAALIAVEGGAMLLRTHDVRPTVDMLKIYGAVAAVC